MHKQLQRKQDAISALDVKIIEAIQNDEELETEILQTEEIAALISTAKAKINSRLTSTPAAVDTTSRTPTRPVVSTECSPEHDSRPTQLPQLHFPQFTGNPLFLQSFWDYFDAAIHSNGSLTGVQKLSYL